MFRGRPADVGALAVWAVALISSAFLIVRGLGGSQLFDRYYIEAVPPLALGFAALPRGALARASTRARCRLRLWPRWRWWWCPRR